MFLTITAQLLSICIQLPSHSWLGVGCVQSTSVGHSPKGVIMARSGRRRGGRLTRSYRSGIIDRRPVEIPNDEPARPMPVVIVSHARGPTVTKVEDRSSASYR